ncbi:pyridoxamine 5'-phosphate oxidase family protein [Streptomyces boncukensis]|uniref:Pyridoxamine 5'-phosphate oxidase family protein n=1 Tax=Streptomyces boncukensis TaxID=2711219 RepID=A0A6G4X3D3_9ACTN|nr:pyridoxamine 5'-phosphate oxidase family protein [Streptomyces boncukensis]NGO71763.1 pyridoxamine 5'-phosphate oxidase family protein [Streptomyces boncukensis]
MTFQDVTRWSDVQTAEPDFAKAVEARFAPYRHHVLGTLRADGAPRLTGIEADFKDGELWLGMMPGSRKALDLRRDPRFALHANPGGGAEMAEGDVRVSGRAVEVTDPDVLAAYAAGAPEGEVPDVFHLFRADVREVTRVSIEMPDIVFRVWNPGRALRTIRRGNDDAPAREDQRS